MTTPLLILPIRGFLLAALPVAPQGLVFTEVSALAGLRAGHACAEDAVGMCPQTGGVAVADFDRDGCRTSSRSAAARGRIASS